MSPKRDYPREKDGQRLQFRGMNLVNPPDKMPLGKSPFAQNVRAYLRDRVTSRARQDSSVVPILSAAVHSIRRLNDSTPDGPPQGFILVSGAGNALYANGTQVAHGLSGNPISLLPFRPNESVQPWMYVGDSALAGVQVDSSTGGHSAVPNGMLKVRSDGLCYAMGIAEPQVAPVVSATPISSLLSLVGPVTVYVWNAANGSPSQNTGNPFIWKNPNDPSGRGPIETIGTAAFSTAGDSLSFDDPLYVTPPYGTSLVPVQWTTYNVGVGTVSTNGLEVTWDSGTQFNDLVAGDTIVINTSPYTVAASPAPTNTVLYVTTSGGVQTGVNYYSSTPNGTVILYSPALAADGYVFNAAILGTLYVPAAGQYTFTTPASSPYVNDIIWGIGGSGPGAVSLISGLGTISTAGQTKSLVQGFPLLPRNTLIDGDGYSYGFITATVYFSEPGNYPIEIDWNYGTVTPGDAPSRSMVLDCNNIEITPLPVTAISQSQYRYTYRGSATGATSNPSPASAQQFISVLANTLTPVPSLDPQVDKIDWYRQDAGLTNFTYVGTSPNTSAPFTDSLLDADVSANPLLDFDNYQPFPVIDLPKSGIVNVVNGVATWVSGDKFNIRWLEGTVIIVGTVAYTLNKRPTSNIQLTATNTEIIGGIVITVPITDGNNQVYEIAEPLLAAQPLPYIWGPTDNVNFAFGCGDPINPGVLYWSKGNNLDSAPDTNQQNVTSPSEPLQNGCIVGGLGWVASTERAWLIYPNFFNATATVQGTAGSTWTLQESSLKRGLYIPRCLAVDGGGNVFFRAKDGIYISPGGAGGNSITDEDLFNLFPHEGMIPQPVTIGGFTVYPPDDTQPQAQQLNVANGYLYYDYKDTTGTPRTLVFDIAALGWVWDVYEYPAIVHILEEGPNVNGTLTGNADGSIRALTNTGAEQANSVLLTKAEVAGDVRAQKHWRDIYIEGEEGE
jgi:hypothetical protein